MHHLRSAKRWDYAPYPAVAGRPVGPGVSVIVHDGALEPSTDDQSVTLESRGCAGASLLFVTTDEAPVTLAMGEPRAPLSL
jgi:hypothetical protein